MGNTIRTYTIRQRWEYDDGGRADAGFTGKAGDCVARAIAIASGRPYKEVYDRLAEGNGTQRVTRRTKAKNAKQFTADFGIYTKRKWFRDYMIELGFEWTPTMQIGSGCQVHLKAEELPAGRLICNVSKHLTAVIDGQIRDTYNPDRGGKRCVYGYWVLSK